QNNAEQPSSESRDETLRLLEENRALLLKLAEMRNPAAAPPAGSLAVTSYSPQQAFQNYSSPPAPAPAPSFHSPHPPLQPSPSSPSPASSPSGHQNYSSPP